MSTEFVNHLRQAVEGFWPISEMQAQDLERHFDLLQAWNRRINLTTVDTLEESVVRHYAESIFLASCLPAGISSVIDLGSGSGFPGVGLAVALPDVKVTLIESIGKKCVFLKESTRHVRNVAVRNTRIEQVDESGDVVTSRAVSPEIVAGAAGRIAAEAYMLMARSDLGSRWQLVAPLPWNDASVVGVTRMSLQGQGST